MDRTIVLSYDYSNWNRRQQWTNAPPSWVFRWLWQCAGAIRSASPDAAWPGLPRKPLDATIGQLLAPYCPSGSQGDNQLNYDATCTHMLAVLMAIAMWGYYIACIARWRRFVVFIKTTKCHHWTSACSDITQSDMPTPVVSDISSWKRAPVDMLAPNNNDISNWREALNYFSRILYLGG